MKKIMIFGNSGSGKSTLAKECAEKYKLSHLDLDILAWENTNPPTRKPLSDSICEIGQFIEKNESWVIEGCYSDLLGVVIEKTNEIIFLNPGIETCISNCRNRPWEPHKYNTKEEQDNNLEMLLSWIKQYPDRNNNECSLSSHQRLFNEFSGKKTEYPSNQRNS